MWCVAWVTCLVDLKRGSEIELQELTTRLGSRASKTTQLSADYRSNGVTLMGFDSFLQITLVVETLSFKTHVQ